MGESDRFQEYSKVKTNRFTIGMDGNALMGLLTLNIIFFLILLTAQVSFHFYQQTTGSFQSQVVQWFAIPSNLAQFSERPWTIITYMFSDTGGNLFRILGNMMWLWAFGYILQSMAGNDKIIPIYLYGGVLGGIVFIVSQNIMGSIDNAAFLIGANTGTLAVAMATTILTPKHRLFVNIRGGIPLWVLMLIYLIVDLSGFSLNHAAFSLAHLGGAFAGYLFVYFYRKGYDGSVWMNKLYDRIINLFNPKVKTQPINLREKSFYNTDNRTPYTKEAIITQQRIDEILDKINQRGYQFLTDEEKQILKKASEEEL